ncbi:MAG: PDZ domain-containing protein, partial [Deltaproteobacteria bacterium]|nr:PDZ domain-containing protein [Deltaproteobacteria bacterium]
MNDKAEFCGQCGAKLTEASRFCGKCGQPVSQAPSSVRADAVQEPPEQPATEKAAGQQKKSRKSLLIVSLAIILILGAGAWGGYKWMKIRIPDLPVTQQPAQPASTVQPQPKVQEKVQPSPELSATQQPPSTVQPRPKVQKKTQAPSPNENAPGRVARGWIGLNIQDVPWDVARQIGMATPSGALAISCEPGGPAALGGLLPGDVILQMNGLQVVSAKDLKERVASEPPGKISNFILWRNGVVYQASLISVEKPAGLDLQKREAARQYTSSYSRCFSQFCPGCNDPHDLFKEQTPECRQCEAANQD